MSVEVMTYVWNHSRQTGTHLLMMLAIADHANDEGQCWPMIDRLAAKCRINRRQARSLIKDLEEAGEILVERGQGRGHTSAYTVKGAAEYPFYAEKGQQSTPFKKEKGQHSAPFHKRKEALQRQEKGHSSVNALKNARGVLREPSEDKKDKKEEKNTPPSPSAVEGESVSGRMTPRTPRQKGYSPLFCTFYDAYPRHEDPDDAWKAWQSIDGDTIADTIMAGVQAHKQFNDAWKRQEKRYIKKPAAWLRAGSYKSDFARSIKDEEADRARRLELYKAVEEGKNPYEC